MTLAQEKRGDLTIEAWAEKSSLKKTILKLRLS
jgi:hypothetical protein